MVNPPTSDEKVARFDALREIAEMHFSGEMSPDYVLLAALDSVALTRDEYTQIAYLALTDASHHGLACSEGATPPYDFRIEDGGIVANYKCHDCGEACYISWDSGVLPTRTRQYWFAG